MIFKNWAIKITLIYYVTGLNYFIIRTDFVVGGTHSMISTGIEEGCAKIVQTLQNPSSNTDIQTKM
jgi:hypothetical protein